MYFSKLTTLHFGDGTVHQIHLWFTK